MVGAGPGDAGLLTLRGAELIGRADVVVYDNLVNPDLLRFAPKTAEVLFAGQNGQARTLSRAEWSDLIIKKAREGKCVVRLRGGDPYIFSPGGEEAKQLADAKIPFEVVPGVSSFVAAPNYAGVPLTLRPSGAQLTVVPGQSDSAEEPSSVDWEQVAKSPGTKVIMMGAERIEEIAQTLIGKGMEAGTPIALVRWGTTGRQQTIEGTLANIAEVSAEAKIEPPAIAVIGEVVKLREKLNWFERRPLFGQRIVVTRSRDQAGQLSGQLSELGAEVIEVPTIKIEPPTRREDVVDALLEINGYDWLVFTSPNGVTTFFDYFFRHYHDMRDIGGCRIAAVGPATARKLKELHLQVDLMPDEALASSIAEAFSEYQSIENLRICLLRAEVANGELPAALEALGAIIDDVPCYKTVPETEDPTGAAARLLQTGADWLTFTSGSTVEHFHARFDLPGLMQKFPQTRLASIGPETSKALAALGLKPSVEARQHSIEGLVTALRSAKKA